MKFNDSSKEISIIKFAAQSYAGVGGNPMRLFRESAEWLYECYKNTEDLLCLKASVQTINAYMEMGLLYEASKDIFDPIIKEAEIQFERRFPKHIYPQNLVKRKISHVRAVLGYWPQSKNRDCDAEWITKDILDKVEKKEKGYFCYGRGKNEISFELLILDEDAYLMDLERKKIYVFEKQE